MDNPQHYSHNSTRPLRWINILNFIPGLILLLITIITGVAGVLYITLAVLLTLSALLGLVAVAGKDRSMPWMIYADLCMAIMIISRLIPEYVVIHACRPIRLLLFALTI
jgi:membrane-bound ClpP family serine protease